MILELVRGLFCTQRMGRVVPSEEVRSYPAKKCDRTQRMGRGLPNGQGTIVPCSWVQDDPTAGYKIHKKGHQNDVIMNIMFNLILIHNA